MSGPQSARHDLQNPNHTKYKDGLACVQESMGLSQNEGTPKMGDFRVGSLQNHPLQGGPILTGERKEKQVSRRPGLEYE